MRDSQTDIVVRMRTILLDWLVEVSAKFKLKSHTYYLSVNLLDRFLSKTPRVSRNKLQLIGCACLWLSSKYHEIYAPEMQDFVYISDKAFEDDELVAMEASIAVTLDFDFTQATPLSFLERWLCIIAYSLKQSQRFVYFKHLVFFLSDHSLIEYSLAFFVFITRKCERAGVT